MTVIPVSYFIYTVNHLPSSVGLRAGVRLLCTSLHPSSLGCTLSSSSLNFFVRQCRELPLWVEYCGPVLGVHVARCIVTSARKRTRERQNGILWSKQRSGMRSSGLWVLKYCCTYGCTFCVEWCIGMHSARPMSPIWSNR